MHSTYVVICWASAQELRQAQWGAAGVAGSCLYDMFVCGIPTPVGSLERRYDALILLELRGHHRQLRLPVRGAFVAFLCVCTSVPCPGKPGKIFLHRHVTMCSQTGGSRGCLTVAVAVAVAAGMSATGAGHPAGGPARAYDPSAVVLSVELAIILILYAIGVDVYGPLTTDTQDPAAAAHGAGRTWARARRRARARASRVVGALKQPDCARGAVPDFVALRPAGLLRSYSPQFVFVWCLLLTRVRPRRAPCPRGVQLASTTASSFTSRS
jgi:hypothetical protein